MRVSERTPSSAASMTVPAPVFFRVGVVVLVAGFAWFLWADSRPAGGDGSRLRPKMIVLPAGSFQMGSPSDAPRRSSGEAQHEVRIERPFAIARTEVTQAQWRAVMGTDPSKFAGDDRPVERVSWRDAVEYCNRLSVREGLAECYSPSAPDSTARPGCDGYRLPTEAEWEYAARAGTSGPRYHEPLGDVAWYWDNAVRGTGSVGTKLANAWGLHDMLGNVWEWASDGHEILVGGRGSPTSGKRQLFRATRGCGWSHGASECRAASSLLQYPGDRDANVGFRPVRSSGL